MRIRRLDLTAFGIFTGTVLDLPSGELDFHVIYGPNESGKSTIRNAVANLLYGIGKTSRYNFVHDYHEMSIGAQIEANGKSLDFRRLKRIKNSLVDSTGEKPLPEDALAPFLGNTDEKFFLRMFALDHDGMVRGGRDILDSTSSLGQILFQAAAGLQTLQATRIALEAEADELWGPRSKESRAYTKAEKLLDEARSTLKAVQVTAQKWASANRALEDAVEREDLAQELNSTLSAEREMLERIRRVAPHLEEFRVAREQLAALGAPVLLPEDAGQTVARAANTIIAATSQAEVHQNSIDRDTDALTNIVPDDDVLANSSEIARLKAIVASVRDAERDIPRREGEIAALELRARDQAANIGWSGLLLAEIAERLPAKARRAEIEALANRYAILDNDLIQKSRIRKEAQLSFEDLRARLQELPEPRLHPSLAASLRDASALDVDQRRDDLTGDIAEAQRKIDIAIAGLTPWAGDLGALQRLRPPDDAELRRTLDERAHLSLARDDAERDRQHRRLALVTSETEFTQLEKKHHPVTDAQLAEARAIRDRTWWHIRSGELATSTAGGELEQGIKQADALADRRYSEAENTTKAESLGNQMEALRAEIDELERRSQDWLGRIKHLDDAWAEQINALGLNGLSLGRVPSWTKDRLAALDALSALESVRNRKNTLETRAERYAHDLRDQMKQAGVSASDGTTLKELLASAEKLQAEALRVRTQREDFKKQLQQAKLRLHVAEFDETAASKALADWQQAWEAVVATALLPADIGVSGARVALEVFRELEDAVGKSRNIQRERISTMQRDISEFERSVGAVVARCARDLASRPATSAVDQLGNRLAAAQVAVAERTRLASEIEKTRGRLELARIQESGANKELGPLKHIAGVTELNELQVAILQSDRYRSVKRQLDGHLHAAITSGSGIPHAELEREVASIELAQLGTRLEVVTQSLAEARAQCDECIRQRALAAAEYSRIAGRDDAAKAETRRQSALAQMADAVEEYVRVQTGAELLKWGLARYREEKQGPLLKAAGEFFSTLTDGQHCKLLIEQDNIPRLISKKIDGKTVGVEGMSDGTSDQLFLALRLAALEMHLEEGTPLPFIADDLLIKCDDGRAASSFAALGRLARKTQVLYFTHHLHLVEIAKRATDNKVHVVEM